MLSKGILILTIFIFLAGLYYYSNVDARIEEGMRNHATTKDTPNKSNIKCPDMLIQDGIRFYLYNSRLSKVPGVNPMQFNNLDEYTDFMAWQRKQGLRCPVLFLQKSYNTQGKAHYKMRPSIHDMQGGLPPSGQTPYTYKTQKDNIDSNVNEADGLGYSQIWEGRGREVAYNSEEENIYKNEPREPVKPVIREPGERKKSSGLEEKNEIDTSNAIFFQQMSERTAASPIRPSTTDSSSYLNTKFTKLVDSNHDDMPYNINSLPGNDESKYYLGKKTPLDLMDEKEQHLLHSPNPMDDNWGGADYTESLIKSGYYAGNEVSILVS